MTERNMRHLRGESGKSDADVAIALLKAGLASIPMIGGPIVSLITDFVPSETQRVIARTLENLNERIRRVEGRIDVQQVDKEEFAELFKASYLQIVRTHHQQRLDAIVAIIVNLLLKPNDPDKLEFTELDHFSRCLDLLSLGAIDVLARIGGLDHESRNQRDRSTEMSFSDVADRIPEYESSLLMGLIAELNATNLVNFPSLPMIRTPEYANQTIELTPLGRRFIRHLLELGNCGTKVSR